MRTGLLYAVLGLSPMLVHAQSLQPLTEGEMEAVTGQKGIMVSIEYYYNSLPSDSSSTAFNEDGASNGCSTPGSVGSLADQNCRFAMQLTNRETEWLVFKNGHASLVLNSLNLDAAILSDAYGTSGSFASYFDATKFQDVDTSCLLPGGCTAANLSSTPGMRLHFSDSAGSYDPVSETSSGYENVRFGMYFEGLAVEPNSAAALQDGWAGTGNGSFLGLNIADNNGHQAGIAIGGDLYMYGF